MTSQLSQNVPVANATWIAIPCTENTNTWKHVLVMFYVPHTVLESAKESITVKDFELTLLLLLLLLLSLTM